MKKVFSTLLAAGFIALVACGPSEDAKNAEQATADSIAAAAAADSAAAAAAAAAPAADTTVAMDSTAAAPATK